MKSTMTIDEDGDEVWRSHEGYHREDGPAIIWQTGRKDWRLHDKLHRTDGPAIEFASGAVSWYLNGALKTLDEWLEQNTEISDGEKVMLKLKYG
jgi:hypothetical protein